MNRAMAKIRSFPSLVKVVHSISRLAHYQCRLISASASRHTDGVYSQITAMRTRTPFIEAFRKQQEEKDHASPKSSAAPEAGLKLDLSPKTMSDSYHRVVSCGTRQMLLVISSD
jgi:acyl-coenzyme A thioesterase 9